MPEPLDPVRAAADEAIRCWPDVHAKQVFGHRGYVRMKKMFAFIAEDGLAFKSTPQAAEALYASGEAVPFVYSAEMEMRGWPVMPLSGDESLERALSAARDAYESVG